MKERPDFNYQKIQQLEHAENQRLLIDKLLEGGETYNLDGLDINEAFLSGSTKCVLALYNDIGRPPTKVGNEWVDVPIEEGIDLVNGVIQEVHSKFYG